MVRALPFREPLAFKLSGERPKFGGRFLLLEIGETLKCFLHLCKIRRVVGAQINDPIRRTAITAVL